MNDKLSLFPLPCYLMGMDEDRYNPTLESLLMQMISNQQSLHEEIVGLYEKIGALEQKIDLLESSGESESSWEREDDVLFEEAKEAVIELGKASTSFLQRKLGVGYTRAAKLIDLLEEEGVIGPQDGMKPREVLMGEDDL